MTISGNDISIHSLDERVGREIGLRYWPIGISLVCFSQSSNSTPSKPSKTANQDEDEEMDGNTSSTATGNGETNLILLDPTPLELHLSSSLLSLVLTPSAELVVMEKAGGNPLPVDTILEATKIGSRRAKEVAEIVKGELKVWEMTGGRTVT